MIIDMHTDVSFDLDGYQVDRLIISCCSHDDEVLHVSSISGSRWQQWVWYLWPT